MPAPYRHSVWWDVAAVVFVLALFLVPAGFLAAEFVGGGGIGSGGGGIIASNRGPVVPSPRSGISGWQARRWARPQALRPGNRSSFGSVENDPLSSIVPFSSSWRAEATPSLLDGGEGPSTNRSFSGNASSGVSGPVGTSSPSLGTSFRSEGPTGRASGGSSRAPWLAETRRFSSRVRALSTQLGAMAREAERESSTDRRPGGPRTATRGAGATSQADSPSLPSEPTVPIDDHVHWLLVAGVLWGVWRLWGG